MMYKQTREMTISNSFFPEKEGGEEIVIFLITLYAQNEIQLMEQMEAVSAKYKKEKVSKV